MDNAISGSLAAGENGTSSTSKVAVAPFDDQSADVILRSSDGVNFHVYKIILSLSSSVFQSMFTLPQPSAPSMSVSTVPVIEMAEHSTVLTPLLRACYPARYTDAQPECEAQTADAVPRSPHPTGILGHDLIRQVLEAARKFDIASFDAPATNLLLDLVPKDPIAVYATAVRFSLKVVAAAAAKQTLKFKHMEFESSDSMNYMTAVQLYDLLRYHRRCGEAAHAAIQHDFYYDWLGDLPDGDELDFCIIRDQRCDCYRPHDTDCDDDADWYALPSVWRFLTRVAEAVKNHPDPLVILSPDETVCHPRAEARISESCQYCRATEPMGAVELLYTVLMKLVAEAIDRVCTSLAFPLYYLNTDV